MSAVLRVSALGKRYGELDALRDVSFEADAGELIAVVGPNGAGKTTLLSIIVGIQAASAGTVDRLPRETSAAARGSASRDASRVGWAPQAPALYSKLSVVENLELFARLEGVADPPAAVARMLEQTGLAARARQPVGRLSGGNRQRVNVALGLIGDPPVLALDEPSASLDPGQRARLWEFVRARVAAGTTVLFSTHNVSEAQRYADRLLVLAEGRLLFDGAPQALLASTSEEAQGAKAGGGDLEQAQGTTVRGGDLERALVLFLRARTPAASGVHPHPEDAL